jgi:hypothetical protein
MLKGASGGAILPWYDAIRGARWFQAGLRAGLYAAGSCAGLNGRRQFLANDRHFDRRLDADAHASLPDPHDRDRDLVADQNSFADFA